MRVLQEEERKVRVGSRSAVPEEGSSAAEDEEAVLQRQRGMTEELQGFLGNLGISGMKKSPRGTSDEPQQTSPQRSPRSPRVASKPRDEVWSPPRSPREEQKPRILLGSKTVGRTFSRRSQVDTTRPPTVAELEKCRDYE